MPLVMIDRNGPPEAQTYPVILCDRCNRPVENRGLALWFTRYRPRESSRVYFVHKGRCDRILTSALVTGCYPPGDGWIDLTRELADALGQLAYNYDHPIGADPAVRAGQVEYVAADNHGGWRIGNTDKTKEDL